MTSEEQVHHIHHPDYVKIWAMLVVLLVASVLGAMTGVRWLVLRESGP